jgi:hypothetical protein
MALLLGARPILRFKKLEARSLAMATVPTKVPIFQPRPNRDAAPDVANTANAMPRMVFDGPNRGRP